MRKKVSSGGLTVNAIAGTHVILLGINLTSAARRRCLGFAIQREDHTEGEKYWLSGTKTFASTDPGLGPGGQVSSQQHPIQSFQWADYSAKPAYDYTYTVVPIYGEPTALREGNSVAVQIKTEQEFGTKHSVFFNRGAIASQEYARRFQNQAPSEVGEAAYKWLSRGLLEALLAFIHQARDSSFSLYGAIYEFQWPEILAALKDVSKAGAKVHIVYDGIDKGNGPLVANETGITAAKIKGLCSPRTVGTIMHNKFFVLCQDDRPIAILTGSTNISENGIFGHSNCAHVVDDPAVAAAYLDYWKLLKADEFLAVERTWMENQNSAPPDPWNKATTAVFSPRKGLGVLDWYSQIANSAENALFMTFAFGMHDYFKQVYEQNDNVLRFALMEKEGNGVGLAQGRKDIARIRKLPNVVVAIGNRIALNGFDKWLGEIDRIKANVNVRWIHTKYMLVDPLGDNPVVVTGSANFSKASINTNDENTLVIRGDHRVADIYLGEYMRMYSHYAFREAVANSKKWNKGKEWNPSNLIESDAWQSDYFEKGSQRYLRRRYFCHG
jgi:phosphatidylserine/phosphatidylglycerophosphate/cardiolipin synthase-like enzyme